MNYQMTIGIGDILIRPKILNFIEHEGVYLGNGAVITNTPGKGEHVETLEEFAAGQPLKVRRSGENPRTIIERVHAILSSPKNYDLLFRNCQHTSSEVMTGKAASRQIMNLLLVLVGASVLCVFALRRR